jgi:hypothetical protein
MLGTSSAVIIILQMQITLYICNNISGQIKEGCVGGLCLNHLGDDNYA